MKKNYLILITGLFFLLFFTQCEEEEPQPKAVIEVSAAAVVPLDTVYLDGSLSENAESYEWSLSDGSLTFVPTAGDNSAGYFISKTTGTVNVSLTVTNSFTFSTASASITVSGAVEIGGTLSENKTLNDLTPGIGDPDYIITEDLIIPDGVNLTIEGGVDIAVADDIAIIVDGLLKKDGTSQSIIHAAGTAWKGIHAREGNVKLNYMTLAKAGSASFTDEASEKATVYLSKYSHSLENVTIEGSAGYAVVMDETASLANLGTQRMVFKNNTTGPGIFSLQVLTTSYFIPGSSNFTDATTGTMIHIHGGTINSAIVNFLVQELPYKILGDINGDSFYCEDATLIFADHVGVHLSGTLNISGSTLKGSTETAGGWKGIYLEASGYANVNSSSIMHAGSDYWTTSYDGDIKGGIVLDGAPLVTSDSEFSDNGGYGVAAAYYGQLSISDGITLNNNTEGAIVCNFDDADDVAAIGTFSGYSSAQPIISMKNARTTDLGTWPKIASSAAGIDYYIKDYVSIGTGKTLIVEDQVQVYFAQDAALYVQGTLDAQGSSQQNSINFRGEESTAGYWRGIRVGSGGTIKFDYVQVNFGGADSSGDYQGNLNIPSNVNTTNSFVTNCSFLNGGTYDLYFINGSDDLNITDVSNNNVWSTDNL